MDDDEKAGSKDLLGRLTDSELNELKDTVTRKQVTAFGRKECICAIVAYSESAFELLHRKKLKRDVLFQYLADSDVVASVTSSKDALIHAIIKFWKSRSNQQKNKNAVQGVNPVQKSHQNVPTTYQPRPKTKPESQGHNTSSSPPPPRDSASSPPPNISITINIASPSATSSRNTPMSDQVGVAFATWFYEMFNSQNPTVPSSPEDFGPHHFWPDVNFKLLCLTPHLIEEEITGADLTSQRLLALVKDEQLLFNPNISKEGLLVKSNPHGQLVLIVCGTVHRSNDCLGEFEQLFGLLRDPRFDNNWKVKFTKLRIKTSQVTEMPKLTEASMSEVTALVPV